jgi:hypothetical protein
MNKPATGRLWPVPLALLVGAGLGILFWRGFGGAPAAPAAPSAVTAPTRSPATPGSPVVGRTDAPSAEASSAAPATPPSPLLNGDAAQEAISDLAATYDAASVPSLARYLKHADPMIRSAAKDGLINLGERAAIPFLQEAAKNAPADEAVSLREAAEFLALPTWTEQREARKKAKAAGATGS